MAKWVTSRRRLRNLTVNLPVVMIDLIGEMVRLDVIPSRSEYVRHAIWEKLSRDKELMKLVVDRDLQPILDEFKGVCEYSTHFIIEDRVWQKQ